jgi:4-amino-4-deoxy-L-arabinose transferase-like glycosyltransferase
MKQGIRHMTPMSAIQESVQETPETTSRTAGAFPTNGGVPEKPNSSSRTTTTYLLAIVLIVGIAAGRIASTYHQFTQTVDEPYHIAAGMQLLQQRTATIDHPPFAQIFIALGLYLQGVRMPGSEGGGPPHVFHQGTDEGTERGNAILNGNNMYWRNLALARLGTLPFFLMSCAVVWFWSNNLWGKQAALFSLTLYSLLPPILGHSGLATTDIAAAATLCLALYALANWAGDPTWSATGVLGLAVGMAIATKLSAVLFLVGCAATLLIIYLIHHRKSVRVLSVWKPAGKVLVSFVVAYIVIWAGYLFSVSPVQASRPHGVVDRMFSHNTRIQRSLDALLETPLPAGQLPETVRVLAAHNKGGHSAFFLGEWRRHGWWYFFPVMLLVKTPVPFLLLSFIGAALLMWSTARGDDWRKSLPVVFALVILSLSLSSKITVGLRHIFGVYILLAIVSGYVASKLWDSAKQRVLARVIVGSMVVSLAMCSILAHPDYLAYFNFFAAGHPEQIEVDSDLDWGQDLARLSKWLQAHNVQDVALSYFGTADLSHADLPDFHQLAPYEKTTGWIAISAYNRALPTPFLVNQLPGIAPYYYIPWDFDSHQQKTGPFAWLMAYEPAARVGSSIFVYYIPPD